jgi:hypothetical protein
MLVRNSIYQSWQGGELPVYPTGGTQIWIAKLLLIWSMIVMAIFAQASDVPTSKFIWFVKPGSVPVEDATKTVRYTMSSLVNQNDSGLMFDSYFARMQPGFTLGIRMALVVKVRGAGETGLYADGFKFRIILSPNNVM